MRQSQYERLLREVAGVKSDLSAYADMDRESFKRQSDAMKHLRGRVEMVSAKADYLATRIEDLDRTVWGLQEKVDDLSAKWMYGLVFGFFAGGIAGSLL